MKEQKQDLLELKKELKALRSEVKSLKKKESDFSRIGKSFEETTDLVNTLTNNVLDAVLIIDWQGNVLYANEAAFRLVDLDPAKGMSGVNVFEFIVPDERQNVQQDLDLVRDSSQAPIATYQLISATGRKSWIEALGKKITFRDRQADLVTIRDITDRIIFEDGLRDRQAKLDSIFRAAPTGIGVVINRILIDVNDRITEISGYSRNELLGKSAMILYPDEEDFNYVGREKDRQIKESGIGSVETRWKKKDGSVIDVFLRFSFLDPNNPKSGETFIALDITKRKKIDQSLKDSEERYRRITSAITDYIYTVFIENGKPVRTVHSPACEAVTGYVQQDFDTNPYLWFTMVYEEDRDKVHAHIENVLYNQDVPSIEHRIRRKDGSVRWVTNTPVIHRDISGAMISYDGVVSDVTMRKLAEEALKESEEKLRNIIENSTNAFYSHTTEHLLTYISPQIKRILGYSPEEALRPWRDFISDNPANKKGYQATDRAIRTGKSQPSYELELVTKDGRKVWVEVNESPVVKDGRTVMIVGAMQDITKRKLSEEAFKESEQRYHSMFENNHAVMYLINPSTGRIVDANPAACSFYGYSRERITGMMIDEINTLSRENILKEMRRAIKFSERHFQFKHRLASGAVRDVEIYTGPVMVGGETLLFSIVQDITDRKQFEEALKRSEERFRSITNNLPGVVFQFYARRNGEIGISYVSDRSMDVLGIENNDPDFFIRSVTNISPEYQAPFITSIDNAIKAVDRWEFEARYIKPTGEEIFIRGVSQPEEFEEEIIFNGVLLDVTDRKQAEEALIKSEERFRSMIQNSSDIIIIINGKGVITYETPSVSRILGYDQGYFIGKTPFEFIHPADIDTARAALLQVMNGTSSGTPTEIRFAKADGSWVSLEAIGKNLLGFSGINGAVLTARDITDRKRSENERIEMERRFQHAQKLESLGVLAGGIAHDFNNLLMAILGNLDLSLTDIPAESRSKHFINQARIAARRAADLTNQMLAYSGKGKFDLKTFDLSELVEEMTRLLKASISKTVTLNLQMGRQMPYMTADPGQIQQIIMNLIVNASEAIGDKPGVVAITTGVKTCDTAYLDQSRLKEKPAAGMYVFLEVKDTGCGMDQQTKDRLFDPFYSTKFTGRGLGMAAVLGIVKGHKGAIIVQSDPGEGTSIRVLFPALITEVRSSNAIDHYGAIDSEEVQALSSTGTVLVVDDEDMVLDLCCVMVERLGYRVITSSDGTEALEVFRKNAREIDCVILDLTMPKKDGIATFEELKRIRSDIKVIISSGYSEQEVEHRFKGKNPAGFIKKPFEFKVLRAELARLLKKS